MKPHRKTALAAGLIGAAVLLPSGAWYVTGSREAAARAGRLEREALSGFRAHVGRHAQRLGARLEDLRTTESGRPFYHYQNLYHDPGGAAEGLSVVRSPLAEGAPDPLVWAHFQIDDQGNVGLPTVHELFPELSADQGLALFCSFLAELQDGLVPTPDRPTTEPTDERVLVLERATWEQNLLADAVYASLTGRDPGSTAMADGFPTRDVRQNDTVVVRVGPLRWNTIVVGSGPVLAALREVHTPTGVTVQGLAVSPRGVADWLGSDEVGLRLVPAAGPSPPMVSEPVLDTGWFIEGNASSALAAAAEAADVATRQFRQQFTVYASTALAAAIAAVLLVAYSDRLARQRARFAATAAHELKTPLSTLRLHSEMLAEGLGDPTRSKTYAARIEAEVGRLGRLVANMLDLARLERGSLQVRLTTGDLAASVRECVDRLRPALTEAGLQVEVSADGEMAEVVFDHDAVCQILHNLLDNAEKYTRSTAARRASVVVSADDRVATVEVADNGPGLTSRDRRRLFRNLGRGSGDGEAAGLGLGLPLARALARAQSGDLVYSPGENGGACFRLQLRTVGDEA